MQSLPVCVYHAGLQRVGFLVDPTKKQYALFPIKDLRAAGWKIDHATCVVSLPRAEGRVL